MGMSDQTGNEIDEFVTETLRNNLLGLPLDLPTINMTRARAEGIPSLNDLRRQIYARTSDSQLMPYTSWVDFGLNMKHPESLVNFVAAYGTHPTILTDAGPDGTLGTGDDGPPTLASRRAAALLLVDPPMGTDPATIPADAADFMNSNGTTWGTDETGLNTIDLWMGGLAERTNLFGGLLGSTFNYVFEEQLTNLQNSDRLYYLGRTPGMNLRAQLEGNSFAELVQRNTNAHTLKADAFATADCKFQLSHLDGTSDGYLANGSNVANDPTTECDEHALLIRMPNGTIRYRTVNTVDPPGINGQAVYQGTNLVDRIWGGVDNDTFWGGAGNDVIEGNDGADVALGGDGNDIITDSAGDDVLKGGPGNDAIESGPGLDIIMGGEGKDFTNGGANINETFGGTGDDFMILGQGEDAAQGDSGDDWMQGGDQPDLLQGDSGNLFFIDTNKPGNDVMIGQAGDDDYDAEGGDDIMIGDPGIEKAAGAAGYDFLTGFMDPQATDADLRLPILPADILVAGVRDRFNEVEGLSGGKLNDTVRGDSFIPVQQGGVGFIGCDVLNQEGLDRIAGLDAIVPPLNTPASTVLANTSTQDCPLNPGELVWGDGNILLGGAGNDLIEGRGADDVIDGDQYLSVRLSVRTDAADPTTEIGSADLMEHQYLHTVSGALTGPTLQKAVMAGSVDPGNIVIVRELLNDANPTDVDTALFSDVRANYTITPNGDGSTVVSHLAGAGIDGTDTVWNIELLQFSDQTFNLTALTQNTRPTGTVNLTTLSPTQGVALTATRGFTDAQGVNLATLLFTFQAQTAPGVFTDVATGDTFTPTQAQVGQALRVVATFVDGAGVAESVTSGLTAPVANVNDPPVGVPTITPATAAVGSALTASTAGISDADGLVGVTFTFQWQQQLAANVPTNIAGATGASFTPTAAQVGRSLRVVVSYVDNLGTAETVTSASTNVIGPVGGGGTVPGAPGIGTAQRGGGGAPLTAIIRWTAPAANGGSAITGYRVTALRMSSAAANATVLSRNSSALLGPGVRRLEMTLAAGTYRFEVVAVNARGASLPSARSNAVVPR
jgi:Ca2+-binding RTX toxin-like protein